VSSKFIAAPPLAVRHFHQFHRHQHAAVSALIPLVKRRGFFVRFGVSKQNYDATPLDQWYERRDGGVLVPVEL
ncbi:helicase RepA family protein, partial [Aeromonas caviae]|uniref:helicase RepA family protein n=1 Tax=Aeromonas caviae TaxID=648 RepID=UPI001CC48C32